MQGGHLVIHWKTAHSASEADTTMTASSSIDRACFLHDQLASAPPDLLRSMLTTFVNTLMPTEADAVCGARTGRRRRTGSLTSCALARQPSCARSRDGRRGARHCRRSQDIGELWV